MKKIYLYSMCCLLLLGSCIRPADVEVSPELPPVYPDYTDITIPPNIAPLHFMLRNDPDAMEVTIKGKVTDMTVRADRRVRFSAKKWRSLLEAEKGNPLTVQVTARVDGQWIRYAPFCWHIAPDEVDPYLSYRLIEPGYEVWNQIQLRERHVESFTERVIADNNLTERSCMNCHVYGNQDPDLSFFHIRGGKGGTVLNRNGSLRKLNTLGEGMISTAVYGSFHPSGRYAVFSTNIIIPEFHAFRGEKLEVYDTVSDLIILDLDENRILTSPWVTETDALETFPVFSADGRFVYFCRAEPPALPDSISSLRYDLCRIAFDASAGEWGDRIDTVYAAQEHGKSVCHPKTSPDGRFLSFTVADYGTFPIWHRETDLHLMDLQTGETDPLEIVNSDRSDTYHSWSSNSRWFVFASKREDGLYGKPYFCYVDSTGKAHKPFVLPQRDPAIYDDLLKSFNIPELSTGSLPFHAMDIEHWYNHTEAEPMKRIR